MSLDTQEINTIAALGTVAGAIIAGWAAWIAARIGKKTTELNVALMEQTALHNRLTVRPLLTKIHHLKDEPNGFSFSIGIKNDGIGPAIIKDVKFYYKGELVKEPELWSDVTLVLARLCFQEYPKFVGKSVHHGSLGTGAALSVQEEKTFLHGFIPYDQRTPEEIERNVVKKPVPASELRAMVLKALEYADLEVFFTSVYGEEFEPLTTWKESKYSPPKASELA